MIFHQEASNHQPYRAMDPNLQTLLNYHLGYQAFASLGKTRSWQIRPRQKRFFLSVLSLCQRLLFYAMLRLFLKKAQLIFESQDIDHQTVGFLREN